MTVCLLITVLLGVWAAQQAQRNSRDGYFLANRSSNPLIVSVSLLSGLTSGISVLGIPGFVYGDEDSSNFGFIAVALSYLIAAFVMNRYMIPFFCELQCVTIHTYLEARFCQHVRTVVSLLFVLKTICYLAVVLYAPSIVIQQFSHYPAWYGIIVFGCLTTAITAKGGISAVIWTDFTQSIIMLIITVSAVVAACALTPSADLHQAMSISSDFWRVAPKHKLLTAYSATIGYSFANIAQHGCDQIAVQRYLATRDVETARFSCFWGAVGNAVYVLLSCCLGAALRGCYGGGGALPGAISNADSVYMFFAGAQLPKGAAGLLVGAIFGCTISTCSGGFNAAAACIVLDLLPAFTNSSADPLDVARVSRLASLGVGILTTLIALGVSALGGELVNTSNSLLGLTFGPILGVFALGMLSLRTNWQGVSVALAAALPLMLYIGVGQILCIDGVQAGEQIEACSGVLALAAISPYWCCAVLSLFTFVVGNVASCFWAPPGSHSLEGLTLWTRTRSKKEFNSFAQSTETEATGG